MIKLNLACGDLIFPGYINVDLYSEKADVKADVKQLPFPDDYADEILAMHIIEHFDFHEGFVVLQEWKRVLKPNGKLVIECPDLLALCKLFIEADEPTRVSMYPQFFGRPWVPGHAHKFLYSPSQLTWTLEQSGFRNITQESTTYYVDIANRCMRFSAEK